MPLEPQTRPHWKWHLYAYGFAYGYFMQEQSWGLPLVGGCDAFLLFHWIDKHRSVRMRQIILLCAKSNVQLMLIGLLMRLFYSVLLSGSWLLVTPQVSPWSFPDKILAVFCHCRLLRSEKALITFFCFASLFCLSLLWLGQNYSSSWLHA